MKIIKPNSAGIADGSFTRASVGYYWNASKVMTEAAIDEPRLNFDPDTGVYDGVMIEVEATNLLLNSETLSTQTVAVSDATQYTLSFYGTGSVDLTDAHVATVNGLGTYKKTTLTFTTSSTSLTLTVTGTVSYAQLETGEVSTSWMKTLGTSLTRSADTITGIGLIYTNVTDPNPVYDSGTTYALNDKVRYNNKIYTSLQNSNTNHQPDTSPTWWYNEGADNMHACFDEQINTSSTATTKLVYIIKPGSVDSIALINMQAVTARITAYDTTSGQVVSRRVAGLSGLDIFDWYQYFFFDPLLVRTQVTFTDFPVYPDVVFTVELEGNPSDLVSVAVMIFGLVESLGGTQYNATSGIVDYSIKSTNDFGDVTFVRRNFSKRLSAQVFIDNTGLNRAQRFLYSTRATPVVWIGSDDPRLEEALVVYGFYKEFSVEISYPTMSVCSLEIEGLT